MYQFWRRLGIIFFFFSLGRTGVKIRKVFSERKKKFGELLNEHLKEAHKNESEKAIENITWMIVLNAFVNFSCKMPLSIISINDLRIIILYRFNQDFFKISKRIFSFPYTMQNLCHTDDICLIFFNFCTFLYVISLSVNIFFYYRFDRNFRETTNLIINRLSKK